MIAVSLLMWAGAQCFAADPVVKEPGSDRVTVHALTIRLPPEQGWRIRQSPMPPSGTLYEIERDLPNGNSVQVHVADYFGQERQLPMELMMSGENDRLRLMHFTETIRDVLGKAEKPIRSAWVETERGPQRRYGAACRENQIVRADQRAVGERLLWQDWMLFCIDPISHLPVQVDYAERYREAAGGPSTTFAEDAAEFFDRIEFVAGNDPARPKAETAAAFVQANNRLFSNADSEDYPATVVFSLDPKVPVGNLAAIAQRLYGLKGKTPSDPHEAAIARHLTDERGDFSLFFRVPPAMCGSDRVFVGGTVIKRALLPKGHLGPKSGYGDFVLQVLVYPATEHAYRIEHVGVHKVKP